MKTYRPITILSLILIFVFACKKKTETVCTEIPLNTAPCNISYQIFDKDSAVCAPSQTFPQAKYRHIFSKSSGERIVEFAFNKAPITGKYYFVTLLDSTSTQNQIASIRDSGSFFSRSAPTETAEVYIENNINQLIISYCNISNSNSYFEPQLNSYIGNKPINFKIKSDK